MDSWTGCGGGFGGGAGFEGGHAALAFGKLGGGHLEDGVVAGGMRQDGPPFKRYALTRQIGPLVGGNQILFDPFALQTEVRQIGLAEVVAMTGGLSHPLEGLADDGGDGRGRHADAHAAAIEEQVAQFTLGGGVALGGGLAQPAFGPGGIAIGHLVLGSGVAGLGGGFQLDEGVAGLGPGGGAGGEEQGEEDGAKRKAESEQRKGNRQDAKGAEGKLII